MKEKPYFLPLIFRDLENSQSLMGGIDWESLSGFSKNEPFGLSVYEDEKNVYVEAQVPGVKPEEILVNSDKGGLWIKGESSDEKKNVKYHVRASKNFSYRVALPTQIDKDKDPEAVCKDGILMITFPKSQKEVPKKILVKT